MQKIFFSILILSFLIVGIGVLAQNDELPSPGITPDSPFYFLKFWKESIQTFFTFGAENKAKQFLHLAEVRLAEYQKMIEKGKTEIAEKTLEKYEKQLNQVLEKAEEAKDKGKDVEELAVLIAEKTLKHQEVLVEVFDKVPEQAKTAIQKAIEMSKKGYQTAIEAVSKIKEEREKIEKGKETLKETEAPAEEKMPQQEIVPEKIKKVPKVEEKPEKESAKATPYYCFYLKDGKTCVPDSMYTPMEDEGIISEDNVIVIYNKKLGEEWPKLELKDALNCISVLRNKFKIDLSEPAKTKLLILDKLVGSGERTYSSASLFGITNFWDSAPANMDYLRKKIEEEGVCLNFHEMTHVFFIRTPILPISWANEGLATYAEREFDPSREKIECRENGWYGSGYYGGTIEQPYSDLSKPSGQGGEPGIYWYYTGYCFWDFIQERYGDSAMIEILQELKKNEDNYSLDFLKDIVNKILNEDITEITKKKFGIPSD